MFHAIGRGRLARVHRKPQRSRHALGVSWVASGCHAAAGRKLSPQSATFVGSCRHLPSALPLCANCASGLSILSLIMFEAAVEAVITGDVATLKSLLRENPELVRTRSTREHRATLLHYVAANGVETDRQKTPNNAVEVAEILLHGGAEVDALAEMYGGHCTTMSMLVSSSHPAEAGVQVALLETLLNFGASIEGLGSTRWRSPLMTALAFGYRPAAEALARRGARVDNLAAAAGLGRLTEARQLLPIADGESRHRALALAAQHGHLDMVRLLLDAGEDPNRYNPDGNHSHSTPLHQAVLAGHASVVRLLVERGARLDNKDTIHQGTPLGWAIYAGQSEIEKYLREQGAKAGTGRNEALGSGG